MNARAILLLVVAFVLGALAAGGIGVRVIREVNTTDDATSLPPSATSTTAPTDSPTYQVDPYETLVSSTALIPTSVEVGGSGLAIGYELITLSPYGGVDPLEFFGIEAADLDHVFPRSWVVETTDGILEGGPANASIRTARFDVADGFSTSEIRSVTITEAFAPYPVAVSFTLSEADPEVEVYPGVSVVLLNVSDQGTSAIVQVGIEAGGSDPAHFFVSGDGPGWRSAVFEAEGRPRVNLTWVGGELPDDIPLVAEGTIWVPIDGPFTVSLEGIQ